MQLFCDALLRCSERQRMELEFFYPVSKKESDFLGHRIVIYRDEDAALMELTSFRSPNHLNPVTARSARGGYELWKGTARRKKRSECGAQARTDVIEHPPGSRSAIGPQGQRSQSCPAAPHSG